YDAATTLSVYAGKIDEDTAVLFAINKTGNNQTADIQIDGIGQISDGTASVAQASSLDSQSVTFNGVSDPANDLSDAPPTPISGGGNPLAYTFAPYSITLLRLNLSLGSQLSVDDVSVEEGDSGTTNAVFTVSLNPDSSDTVTVNYATNDGTATAGSDYTAVSDTLTFNPGQTTKTVSVPVNGDTDPEVDETFTLDLSGALNANISDSQGVATISNDDPPLLTISDVSVDEGDSGSTNAVFTISLSPSSSQTVTVDYETNDDTATAGSDYTAVSDMLIFNPGQTTKTVSVSVNGDNVEEADETFTLDLSAAVNADISDSQGVATILDDDAPTLTISDETIAEGDSGTTNIVFTVTLSPAGIQTVTVDYATTDGTATAGSDYTAVSDTLTFPQGQTTRTITVPIHDDTVFEGIETFTIQLSNANNAIISDSVGLGSIIDLEDASEWSYLPIILKD
ncbi:MAG: hypothetical protein GY803_22985, partial [Chloroflexi bacterium]|nr:hypothetical protein [Chloroflexota bacterium]